MRSAASLPWALLERLERIDDGKLPIAEVARRLCAEAESLGLTRPGYERIRQLVHELRLERRQSGPGRAQVALEMTLGLHSRDRFYREYGNAVERAEMKRARRAKWRRAGKKRRK